MKIGLPKERKYGDKRVAILPSDIEKIIEDDHEVYVEKEAGKGLFISDAEYENVGARIITNPGNIFDKDIVVKIKSPTDEEWTMLGDNILFSMLHAEQNPDIIENLKKYNVRGIAMEKIVDKKGRRMIEALKITAEQGLILAFKEALKSPEECEVLVMGYGNLGRYAIGYAMKEGAEVEGMRRLDFKNIEEYLKGKDIVVNAIKWPKYKRERKEHIITKDMLKYLNNGAIVLDLAVDEPNPIETCHPTTLQNPWYYEEGIKHICIYGYPGLAPVSCSERYSKQITPLLLDIADNGLGDASEYIKKAMIK